MLKYDLAQFLILADSFKCEDCQTLWYSNLRDMFWTYRTNFCDTCKTIVTGEDLQKSKKHFPLFTKDVVKCAFEDILNIFWNTSRHRNSFSLVEEAEKIYKKEKSDMLLFLYTELDIIYLQSLQQQPYLNIIKDVTGDIMDNPLHKITNRILNPMEIKPLLASCKTSKDKKYKNILADFLEIDCAFSEPNDPEIPKIIEHLRNEDRHAYNCWTLTKLKHMCKV